MRLYLITDDAGRAAKDLGRIVSEAIAGGVTAVQFREKSAGPNECVALLNEIIPVCKEAAIPLIMNADVQNHLRSPFKGNGIHYGKRTAPSRQTNPNGGCSSSGHPTVCDNPDDFIFGYSAHQVEEIEPMLTAFAHFVTLSPIFATPSKEEILAPLGLGPLRQAREKHPDACIVALGGINSGNAKSAIEAGASGIAVIRAIMAAPNPRAAARELRDIVDARLAR